MVASIFISHLAQQAGLGRAHAAAATMRGGPPVALGAVGEGGQGQHVPLAVRQEGAQVSAWVRARIPWPVHAVEAHLAV